LFIIPKLARNWNYLPKISAQFQVPDVFAIATVGNDNLRSDFPDLSYNIAPEKSTRSKYGGNNATDPTATTSPDCKGFVQIRPSRVDFGGNRGIAECSPEGYKNF